MQLFIDPFTPWVWLGIAAMTAIIGPILYVVHRVSPYYRVYDDHDRKHGCENHDVLKLSERIFYLHYIVFKSLCLDWIVA